MSQKFTSFIMTSSGATATKEMLEDAFAHIPVNLRAGTFTVREMHTCFSDGFELTAVRFKPEKPRNVLDAMLARLSNKITPTPLPGFTQFVLTGSKINSFQGGFIRLKIRTAVSRQSYYEGTGPVHTDMLREDAEESETEEIILDYPQIDGDAYPDAPIHIIVSEPEEEENTTRRSTRRRRNTTPDDEPAFPAPADNTAHRTAIKWPRRAGRP